MQALVSADPSASRDAVPRVGASDATPAARSVGGFRVAVLTAGRDKPYALGIGPALAAHGQPIDFLGSDSVDGPEVRNHPLIRYLNFRDQAVGASLGAKMTRILAYYARLVGYAARSDARVFHLLWNNKFEYFDRTLLTLYYRLLGKRVVFTAHNVNAGKRDNNDSWLNRLTLRIQYRLCHHVFVHTRRMKDELITEFGMRDERVTVIPFGINNTLPTTPLTQGEARARLGLAADDQVLLFFGNIAPYKGVDVLVSALAALTPTHPRLRVVIAGRPKGSEAYWAEVRAAIAQAGLQPAIREFIEYIPDENVEIFFKAADALVLPYTHVFQSGVLFLGYSFGLPVIATDVGSLREEIVEDRTGWVCQPKNPADLAAAIQRWLQSDVYRHRETQRAEIKAFANRQYSWSTVADMTTAVYEKLVRPGSGK